MIHPADESEPDSFGDSLYPIPAASGRRGALLLWGLAAADLLLAGALYLFLRYLAGAEAYLVSDSAEFGSELDAALAGLAIMRAAGYVLIAGFGLAALAIASHTRAGYRIHFIWSVLVSLTLAGLVYGIPSLLALRSRSLRDRVFGPDPPVS